MRTITHSDNSFSSVGSIGNVQTQCPDRVNEDQVDQGSTLMLCASLSSSRVRPVFLSHWLHLAVCYKWFIGLWGVPDSPVWNQDQCRASLHPGDGIEALTYNSGFVCVERGGQLDDVACQALCFILLPKLSLTRKPTHACKDTHLHPESEMNDGLEGSQSTILRIRGCIVPIFVSVCVCVCAHMCFSFIS